MRSDTERLVDMVEAIERVECYSERGRDAFASDELIQTWYFQVDLDAVWNAVELLAGLRAQLEAISST